MLMVGLFVGCWTCQSSNRIHCHAIFPRRLARCARARVREPLFPRRVINEPAAIARDRCVFLLVFIYIDMN